MWEREEGGCSYSYSWGWWKGRAKLRQRLHQNEFVQKNLMMVMRLLMGWLRSRRRRFIFLVVCSPFLLPFLCLTFPFFCLVELCLRLFCRRRYRGDKKGCNDRCEEEDGGCGLCRCEEGRGGEPIEEREGRLLQRYLEDQLGLVGSVYDCGDEGFGDLGEKTSPLLQ